MDSLRQVPNSLGFVPAPLPDELLYSVFARWSAMTGARGKSAFSVVFDVTDQVSVDPLFTGQLNLLFSKMMADSLQESRLFCQHTMLPVIARFCEPRPYVRLRTSLRNDREHFSHGPVKSLALHDTFSFFLSYCPVCVEEDTQRHGLAYWRRTHQLRCVVVCPNHYEGLRGSFVRISRVKYFVLPKLSNEHWDRSSGVSPEIAALFAETAAWLVANPGIPVRREKMLSQIAKLIGEDGKPDPEGRFPPEICQALAKRFDAAEMPGAKSEFWTQPASFQEIAAAASDGWPTVSSPAAHIAMMLALDMTPEQYFSW